jgi:hypothetical protein
MNQTTDYLAPYSLWLCVRRHYCSDGSLFVEPAWTGCGAHIGPVIFVSRLHAHLYTALRNRHHGRGDSNNWQCVPLHAFGLHEHILEQGGTMNCEMAFGFVTDETGALVLADGAPQMRFVELSFTLDDATAEASTFSFNQWAFDYMQVEWLAMGASTLPLSFDLIDGLSNAAFARVLDAALSKTRLVREHGFAHWAVYDPQVGGWLGAPVCAPLNALTLH